LSVCQGGGGKIRIYAAGDIYRPGKIFIRIDLNDKNRLMELNLADVNGVPYVELSDKDIDKLIDFYLKNKLAKSDS